jgi:hypothetical protein
MPGLLEEVPLSVRQGIWFQHDGAPPHCAENVRKWLDVKYPGRWIGRGGHIASPPCSRDLTPFDLFLWGHLKEHGYAVPPTSIEDLVATLHAAIITLEVDMLQASTILYHVTHCRAPRNAQHSFRTPVIIVR